MPTFRIVDEQGRWLTDMRLNGGGWKPVTGSRKYPRSGRRRAASAGGLRCSTRFCEMIPSNHEPRLSGGDQCMR
jgi:hypothetical protein